MASDQSKTNKGNIWAGPEQPTTASNDPLARMIEIAKDTELSPEDKSALIQFSHDRFKNRRIMAYISLWTIIASLAFLLGASIFDGTGGNPTKILTGISQNQGLIGTVLGFLTAIVGAYYGLSSLRPSS